MPYNTKKRRKYNKEYRRKNKKKIAKYKQEHEQEIRNKEMQYRYGITFTEYSKMLKNQGNVCKICGGINPGGNRLAIDHDHKTGKIRGLLCIKCNIKIGWYEVLKDNIARYLQRK